MTEAKNNFKNNFPLEKILTISFADYCLNTGKDPTSYEFVGVQANGTWSRNSNSDNFSIAKVFARKVPDKTEVVVGYNASDSLHVSDGLHVNHGGVQTNHHSYTAQGTALIPK